MGAATLVVFLNWWWRGYCSWHVLCLGYYSGGIYSRSRPINNLQGTEILIMLGQNFDCAKPNSAMTHVLVLSAKSEEWTVKMRNEWHIIDIGNILGPTFGFKNSQQLHQENLHSSWPLSSYPENNWQVIFWAIGFGCLYSIHSFFVFGFERQQVWLKGRHVTL